MDSLPWPGCRFARATFCRRFRYQSVQAVRAAYGFDHVARQTFWGLRVHLHVAWPGLMTRLSLTPANCSDSDVATAPQLNLPRKSGQGDRDQVAFCWCANSKATGLLEPRAECRRTGL